MALKASADADAKTTTLVSNGTPVAIDDVVGDWYAVQTRQAGRQKTERLLHRSRKSAALGMIRAQSMSAGILLWTTYRQIMNANVSEVPLKNALNLIKRNDGSAPVLAAGRLVPLLRDGCRGTSMEELDELELVRLAGDIVEIILRFGEFASQPFPSKS